MKRLTLLLLLTTLLLCGHLPQARAADAPRGVTAAKPMPVLYSFDQYAQNTKVSRTYISETMLEAAARNGSLKSDTWNLSKVLPRLTGVLMLHTHSRSTTKSFRDDQKKVSQMGEYECLMSTRADNVELQVFVRRSRGKTIQELLVFRFRDDYCTRVIQLTGKLRDSDIAEIIKMTKSKSTSDDDLLTPRGNLPDYYLGDAHDYSARAEDYNRLVENYRAQMDSAQAQMAESLQRMHGRLADLEAQGVPIGDYDRLLENYRQQIDEARPLLDAARQRMEEYLPRIDEYLPRIDEYRQRMREQRPPCNSSSRPAISPAEHLISQSYFLISQKHLVIASRARSDRTASAERAFRDRDTRVPRPRRDGQVGHRNGGAGLEIATTLYKKA